jgi:hypothetical protein
MISPASAGVRPAGYAPESSREDLAEAVGGALDILSGNGEDEVEEETDDDDDLDDSEDDTDDDLD